MVGGSFDNEEEVESLNPSLVSNPSSKSSSTKSSSKKKSIDEEEVEDGNHNNSDRPSQHKSKKKKSKRRHSEKSRKRSGKDNKEGGGENDTDLYTTTRSESQGSGSVATTTNNDESSLSSDRRKKGYGRKTSFSNSTKILMDEEVTGQPPLEESPLPPPQDIINNVGDNLVAIGKAPPPPALKPSKYGSGNVKFAASSGGDNNDEDSDDDSTAWKKPMFQPFGKPVTDDAKLAKLDGGAVPPGKGGGGESSEAAPSPSPQRRPRFSLAERRGTSNAALAVEKMNGFGNNAGNLSIRKPPQDDNDDDNHNKSCPGPKRRTVDNTDTMNREDSFKPQRITSRSMSRRASHDPALGGSLTKTGKPLSRQNSQMENVSRSFASGLNNRPGIQRRQSMGSVSSSSGRRLSGSSGRHLSREAEGDVGVGDIESLKMMNNRHKLTPGKSMAMSVRQDHKTVRRQNMSVEYQTFIPPKSRYSSVISKVAYAISMRIVNLTLWTYQASFFKVMIFFLGFYIVNIFVWAAVLDAVDLASGGYCIHEDPDSFSRSERYELVFELSWATFTTVGYGTVSPSGEVSGCYPIRFTCAFVAFIGVIFASQTAAILYGKLMRMLAKAHVTFSSTLCIQYGKGNDRAAVNDGQMNLRASVATGLLSKLNSKDMSSLMSADDSDRSGGGPFRSHSESSADDDDFPVIEFRIINDRANFEGSEIWDAQIRGIVQLNKEQQVSSPLNRTDTNSFALGGEDRGAGGVSSAHNSDKKVYYPVSLAPDSHPHFNRIWYARHTLNAESPLLKREVRDMILRDGGKWDKEMNNYEEIRDCLNEFCSLRITISGTSAVSASGVYGEHVYGFDDVCVGWRFANMVYEKGTKRWCTRGNNEKELRTKIDIALLHDIIPQPGGDHEPLNETPATTFFSRKLSS